MIILDIYKQTGITATAGVGDNLYLAKVAMDIMAKHTKPNKDGVRIAHLTEQSYRELLWDHTPLTDFWRVGRGYTSRLFKHGLVTMGDIARQSLIDEDVLYEEFGVNAELLIDHAWGYEPATIEDIKSYQPENNSLSIGQVLPSPYDNKKGKLIAKEMADALSLDLVNKGLVINQVVLWLGYDITDLKEEMATEKDWMGRTLPKGGHGTINLRGYTSSSKEIVAAIGKLYEKISNKNLHVRRLGVMAPVYKESEIENLKRRYEQLNLFQEEVEEQEIDEKELAREKEVQKTLLNIKKKFGKNAIVKGMDLEEGGTTRERNEQIGGHKA